MRVLVGYTSRFGSTRDIAKRIAGNLRMHGSDVDVRSVDEISDVDTYGAVVFASGVYDGSWTAEATDFVQRHSAILARKPVWLFSVGSFGDQHPIVGGLMKKEPREISESRRIRLSPELQSDHAVDANVRLPPRANLEAESDAVASESPHTTSRRERAFA